MMANIDLRRLNSVLLELHNGARSRAVEHFRDWAFDLSPSTVSNQLTMIYTKLGISNKSELQRLIERWR